MATATVKAKKEIIMLPEALVLWHALFERDAFKKDEKSAPGTPSYKIMMAFDKSAVTGEGTVEDQLADALDGAFPAHINIGTVKEPNMVSVGQAFLDGERGVVRNLKDGDELAAARVAAAKAAGKEPKDLSVYKGKVIVSANSIFNREGEAGPGGSKVYGPDTSAIGIVEGNTGEIYAGCRGIAAVTIETYTDSRGDKGVKFYLVAFQKTKDGPRLASDSDNTSGLFKPVSGTGSADTGSGVRRRRAG